MFCLIHLNLDMELEWDQILFLFRWKALLSYELNQCCFLIRKNLVRNLVVFLNYSVILFYQKLIRNLKFILQILLFQYLVLHWKYHFFQQSYFYHLSSMLKFLVAKLSWTRSFQYLILYRYKKTHPRVKSVFILL
jgi:hypothetical protein